ncbi:hypothetical protein B0T11DRAFT_324957 [Plectosphaerella cucumerina]|uniref:Uncharacterized protein n=1 Tax=Plectosphaerella cucumerina TaxID=40658 RepID=A0A8K0XA35_9PEZI|nr:hypothetical protein B0T11DRAFT_324957 [Plectosphaerella cucumerina]
METPMAMRLLRSYRNLNTISMVLSSSASFMIRFDDHRHGASPRLTDASAGLFTSTVITGVVAVLITTMLSFHLEGCDVSGAVDHAVAWLPVVLVDLTIVEFLVGLVAWYTANFGCWPAAMISGQLGAMGLMSLFVAVYMGRMMHQDGSAGLGGGKEDVVVASGDKAAEVGK